LGYVLPGWLDEILDFIGINWPNVDNLSLPGVLPLVLCRTHLSTYRHGRLFGPSWASTLDKRLKWGASGIWWHREDGSSLAPATRSSRRH
jgi:hypothetical protein